MLLLGAAVVALILAIVLSSTLLYGLVALLVIAFVVMQFGGVVVSGIPGKRKPASPVRSEPKLADLGILEIRPKESIRPVRGSGNGILEQEPSLIERIQKKDEKPAGSIGGPTGKTSPIEKEQSQDTEIELPQSTPESVDELFDDLDFDDAMVSKPRPVRKKDPADAVIGGDGSAPDSASAQGSVARYPKSFAGEPLDAASLIPLLESVVASLEATTVVVLTRIAESPSYRIAGIVSTNAQAKAGGQFIVDAPYLSRRRTKNEVVHLVKGEGLEVGHTRYYEKLVPVEQLSIIQIAASTGDYLLVADFDEPVSEPERVEPLLVGYAAALRALLSSSTILSNAALAKTSVVVTRALERARADNSPLAMALVCMKDGESFLASERDVVLAAERELASILDEMTPDGKVEKLADLTFGVFLSQEVNRVEKWALSLQNVVDERATSPDVTSSIVGSVTIGVAMLTARHQTADDLREDALAALEESFKSGACTILE